ncbi:MAG TPA: hypothetical protein VHQ45_05040, partial [Gemmatimonadaceae bacterium]|nr:hypothetical protein [Gemmatimonadaceae bacterium]
MAAYGYLLAGLVMGLFALVASSSLVVAGLCALVGVVAGYAMLPVIALDFANLPMLAFAGAMLGLAAARAGHQRRTPRATMGSALAVALALGWLIVLPMATSTPMLHAGAYRALIGPVDTLRNAPDLAPVDPAHVRMVDGRLAERLAERVLGERGALGSQVTVGTMDLQVVRGEWWWVAPLNHAGFFRWLENRAGTPGYVMVSATDSRDVRLVTTLDGAPLALRHNAGAWLGDVPARHLYANGYATRGLIDFSFEIDDDGRPFLVATEIEHRVGFSGATPVGAVILDVQTGAHTRCAIADCPAWVDLIQPTELVTARINDWGEYVHGWFNPSKKNQLAATAGTARILDRAGHQFHYTGIRSASADRGTTGYMLVDTRTGAATYYLQAGATEEAA